jgi:hypothetical protein
MLGTALVQHKRLMVDWMQRGMRRTGSGRAGFGDQGSEVGDHAKGSAANTRDDIPSKYLTLNLSKRRHAYKI